MIFILMGLGTQNAKVEPLQKAVAMLKQKSRAKGV